MKFLSMILTLILLAACNSVYFQPNSIDPTQVFYADRGGYGMRKSIKQKMDERGYNVIVGTAVSSRDATTNAESIEIDSAVVPDDARYIVKVSERREKFNPFWCPFNGFWWWNFNISITDQKTGAELLAWRGRACQNSALRMLDDILDEMEVKNVSQQ